MIRSLTQTKKNLVTQALLLLVTALLLKSAIATHPNDNIVDTAANAGDFTILVAALEATGLDVVLADEHASFTVFAPTDAAFNELGQDTIDALLNDPETLANILLYHVVDRRLSAFQLWFQNGRHLQTVNGENVSISATWRKLFINESKVIAANVGASNGVIHAIDKVLIPPQPPEPPQGLNIVETAIEAGGFDTLVAALQATGLDQALADENSNFTVFAPTDAAFDELGADTIAALLADTDTLSDILLYHAISGVESSQDLIARTGSSDNTLNGDGVTFNITDEGLYINQSLVVVKDIPASNGVIHVIDRVLLPISDEVNAGTIVDIAASDENFSILVAALQATGLDRILSLHFFDFTVFAPTNAAFEALGQDTIDALLADPAALANILLYHVAIGDRSSVEVLADSDTGLRTLIGQRLDVSIESGDIFVDASQVVAKDIKTENGTIHVIDAVLIPNAH